MGFRRTAAAVSGAMVMVGCSALIPGAPPDALHEIRSYHAPLIRQSPSRVATKFQKMQKDLLSFNRGVNPLFYRYVQGKGLPEKWLGTKSRGVVLHGDCHAENIGAYASASGAMVVDLVDFDDSFRGPYLLDLYRAASSLYLSAKTDAMRERVLRSFVESYARTMQDIASGKSNSDIVLDASSRFDLARELVRQASSPDLTWFYSDLLRTRVRGGKREFIASSDYVSPREGISSRLMRSYLQAQSRANSDFSPEAFAVLDAVIEQGSGIGSAGSYKVLVIVQGPTQDPGDDVILEFKSEGPPAGQAFADQTYEDQGLRVLRGERVMQTRNAAYIGSARMEGRDFFVSAITPYYQELSWKTLVGIKPMSEAAAMAGLLLAKGHARTDAQPYATAKEIASLLSGNTDALYDELIRFSKEYAAYLQEGFKSFCKELTLSPVLMVFSGMMRWAA